MNCFKKCIFAVIQTTSTGNFTRALSCELLQKVYLCSNTNNSVSTAQLKLAVVNCFKKCIFAVIQTTLYDQSTFIPSCELLQKVYLCSNTNNRMEILYYEEEVVNCFKKCIFAVIQTTISPFMYWSFLL